MVEEEVTPGARVVMPQFALRLRGEAGNWVAGGRHVNCWWCQLQTSGLFVMVIDQALPLWLFGQTMALGRLYIDLGTSRMLASINFNRPIGPPCSFGTGINFILCHVLLFICFCNAFRFNSETKKSRSHPQIVMHSLCPVKSAFLIFKNYPSKE